ncbi:MAG TPA: tRNA (adenosine(37)-N6)-threonylcarbamoyltransferase complex dimerization subunit type 1 TsaB [Solirubrobacteraceae bacterium]
MIILGIDTSTPATTVGLRLAEGPVLEARDDPGPGERPGHATRLLGLTQDLLSRAGIGWGALQRIAVGVGPGTFTGLRVGVATARGLALALGSELVGVSSLHALAHGAQNPHGTHERVLAILDARRGEAFAAAYRDGREIAAPRALTPTDLLELADELLVEGSWLAIGDGALRFGEQLRAAGVKIPAESSPLHLISAAAICDLGKCAPIAEPEMILPDYCRRPDAELALEARAR